MNLVLRDAKPDDLPAIGTVHQRSRSHAYAHLLKAETLERTTVEGMTGYWTERWGWEQELCRLTVADRAGDVAGFTYVGPSETPGAVELYAIHVLPEAEGTGVGRALMLDALAKLQDLATPAETRAVLWVLTGNTHARRFYEKGGWQPDGETRDGPINGETIPQVRYSRALTAARS